ncbi:MAG TPA: hypothetical protein VKM55_07225 [Candidatus Lokiarchaeia archaeon]|nr:hypothetical protein [Candidatus Lokiarchaeia archaeon]
MARLKHKALLGAVLLVCLETSCFLGFATYLYAEHYNNDLVFNLGNAPKGHVVIGFGANLWDGDPFIPGLVHDLHFKIVRMFYGGANPPSNVTSFTRADYDSLYAGLAKSATIDAMLASNVSIIVTPGIPNNWLNASKAITPQYVQPMAMVDGALAGAMARLNQTPAYIEPFNEPDGSWSGHVPPNEYNTFVKLLRAELDARGLQSVGIDGPGLAHVDLGNSDPYVDALDASGVAAVGAWSLHGYEWNSEARQDPAVVRSAFSDGFMNSVQARDPAHVKPIIISEYSTFAFSNASGQPDSESIPFAIRVFENSLSFLNGGADALIYWQAHDQSWDPTNTYSFLRLSGAGRPVYYAIKTLYPVIPIGARVLPIDHQAYGAYGSVFMASNCTILVLVNHLNSQQTINVKPTGMENMHVVNATGFENGMIINGSSEWKQDASQAVMPSMSTLTLIFTR